MATNVQSINASGAGYNQVSAEQAEIYNRTLLDTLKDNVVYLKYGEKRKIKKNQGNKISFRRIEMPEKVTTALTEGITPDGIDIEITKLSATLAEYGAWTKVSSQLELTAFDPIIDEYAELLGEHGAISIDAIILSIISAGTNVKYSGSATSRMTVSAGISYADILAWGTLMKKNNVKPIRLPNKKKGYVVFVSPEVAEDIKNLSEWKTFNSYNGDNNNFEDGCIGSINGFYFIETNEHPLYAGAGAASIDVYGTIIIGKQAFGVPALESLNKPKIIIHTNGGTDNPLNMFSTVGWKTMFSCLRLNEKCIIRYESAA